MHPQKIIIADDEPSVREFVRQSLTHVGFRHFHFAENGWQTLTLAAEQLPDLIIMDICMPSLNGITALRMLKEAQATAEIPIMLMSGKRDCAELGLSGIPGAAAFLRKPFSPWELGTETKRLLAVA